MVKKKKEKKKSYRVWVRAEGQKLNESRGTKRGSNTAYQSGGAERVAVGIESGEKQLQDVKTLRVRISWSPSTKA